MFCAGTDGKIYPVTGGSGAGAVACGSKTVQSIICKNDPDSGAEWVFASSTDKSLNIFSVAGTKLTPVRTYKLDAPAISMDLHNKSLALGLKNGNIEILEIVEGAKPKNVMNTHNEGEVWGLA